MRTHTPRVVSVVDAESYVAARFPQSYLEMADDGMITIYDAVSGRLVTEIFPDGRAHIYDADGSVTCVDAHGRVEGREDVALASSIPAERVTEFVFSDDEAPVVEGSRRVALENGAQRFADEPPTRREGRAPLEPVQEVVIDEPATAPPAARVVAHDDEITEREIMPSVESDEGGDDIGVAVASVEPPETEETGTHGEVEPFPSSIWLAARSEGDVAIRSAAMDDPERGAAVQGQVASRRNSLVEPALWSHREDFRDAVFQGAHRTLAPILSSPHPCADAGGVSQCEEGRAAGRLVASEVPLTAFRDVRIVDGTVSSMIATLPHEHARPGVPLDLRGIADAIRERVVVTVPGSTRLGPVEFGVLAGPATIPVMRVSAGEVGGERRPHVVIDPSSRHGDPPDHRGSDGRHSSDSEEGWDDDPPSS